MTKDVLMHLKEEDIYRVLRNMDRVGAKDGVFLLGTDTRVRDSHMVRNPRISHTGSFRPIDVKKPPFSLQMPTSTVVSSTEFIDLETFSFPLDLSRLGQDTPAVVSMKAEL